MSNRKLLPWLERLSILALLAGQAVAVHGQTTLACKTGRAVGILDANNVRAAIRNTGSLFRNPGHVAYEVPKGSGNTAIFESNFWLGGFVDGELRTAGSTYGPYEFWPGSYSQVVGSGDCEQFDRIFKISSEDLDALNQTGLLTEDIKDWPWQQGAGVVDGDGDLFNYNLEGGDRPELLGNQTLFWVMNDVGGSHHSTDSNPLGVDVHVTAFSTASTENRHFPNTTFYRYKVINRNNSAIENAYVGFMSDIDLGHFVDDYVGSDSTLHLSFGYNSDNFDQGNYLYAPPAVGIQVLQSPFATNDGKDNDYDGLIDEDGEMLGMTSSTLYHGGGGATGVPAGAQGFYHQMTGRWQDGSPFTVGGTGRDSSSTTTKFAFSGMPPAYWSELNSDNLGTPTEAADRKSVIGIGPFSLDPGESENVFLAIATAFGSDHLDSVSRLKAAASSLMGLAPRDIPPGDIQSIPDQITKPTLISPSDGATHQPLEVNLVFNPFPQHYLMNVVVMRTHDSVEVANVYSQAEVVRVGLGNFANHTVQARFIVDGQTGPWSDPVLFTTGGYNYDNVNLFKSVRVVRNAFGSIAPVGVVPNGWGFPGLTLPAPRQQVSGAQWALSFFDASPRSEEQRFQQFLDLSGIDSENAFIAPYDWEIRFDDEENWGELQRSDKFYLAKIPFSVWRTGINSPNDTSDDVRYLVGLKAIDENDTFNLTDEGHPWFNDPEMYMTDLFTIYDVQNPRPGSRDYEFWLENARQNTRFRSLINKLPARFKDMTLVRVHPGFVADSLSSGETAAHRLPEPGTVIRIETLKPPPPIVSSPVQDQSFEGGPVRMFWTGYKKSQLVLARDNGFTNPIWWSPRMTNGDATSPALSTGAYYVKALDEFGGESQVVQFYVGTSTLSDELATPLETALFQNYPNPFRGSTTLSFSLKDPSAAKLDIFDLLGRHVVSLFDGYTTDTTTSVTFDASGLPGGVYVVRLTTPSNTLTKTTTVLK